jgi:hypothetical protein
VVELLDILVMVEMPVVMESKVEERAAAWGYMGKELMVVADLPAAKTAQAVAAVAAVVATEVLKAQTVKQVLVVLAKPTAAVLAVELVAVWAVAEVD